MSALSSAGVAPTAKLHSESRAPSHRGKLRPSLAEQQWLASSAGCRKYASITTWSKKRSVNV